LIIADRFSLFYADTCAPRHAAQAFAYDIVIRHVILPLSFADGHYLIDDFFRY